MWLCDSRDTFCYLRFRCENSVLTRNRYNCCNVAFTNKPFSPHTNAITNTQLQCFCHVMAVFSFGLHRQFDWQSRSPIVGTSVTAAVKFECAKHVGWVTSSSFLISFSLCFSLNFFRFHDKDQHTHTQTETSICYLFCESGSEIHIFRNAFVTCQPDPLPFVLFFPSFDCLHTRMAVSRVVCVDLCLGCICVLMTIGFPLRSRKQIWFFHAVSTGKFVAVTCQSAECLSSLACVAGCEWCVCMLCVPVCEWVMCVCVCVLWKSIGFLSRVVFAR